MTKSAYSYPPDEFDVAVPGGAPVGVHRAPRSGWSSAWPFMLVAVVCAVVAWGVISFITQGDGPAEAETPPAVETSPTAGASTDPSAAAPDAAASPTPEAPAAPDIPTLVAAIDQSAKIAVYNTSGIPKLAAGGANALVAQGVTSAVAVAGDPPAGADSAENTVLYGANRENEAKAAAAIFGIPETAMVLSDEVSASPEAVWVILKTQPEGVTPAS